MSENEKPSTSPSGPAKEPERFYFPAEVLPGETEELAQKRVARQLYQAMMEARQASESTTSAPEKPSGPAPPPADSQG